ncbi:MAG: cytochrome P450 [Polyangiaceae bacterium]
MIEDAVQLFSARQTLADPERLYSELREKAPVHFVKPLNLWLLSRYDDIQWALRNPDLFSSKQPVEMRRPMQNRRLIEAAKELGTLSLIGSDPPEHTRLRKLVSGVFSPKATARLEGRIRALAVEMTSAMAERDEVDLMEDLAAPLPVTVISELLGVDPARRREFKRWSDDLIMTSGVDRDLPEEEVDRLIASRRQFLDCLRELIAARRAAPKDDLVSDLVRAEVESDTLSANDVLSLTLLLMIAGNETTTNLVGNGTVELLDHPDVLVTLRADPGRIPAFLEETLRHLSPVRMLSRRAAKDVTVRGVTIPEGASVFLLLDAANRDPEVFVEPARFDITRLFPTQLSFGSGIHFCVGAPLARLEGRVVFEEMLRRLPAFTRRAGPLDWQPTFGLRGLRSLQLVLHRTREERSHPRAA